MVPNVERRSNGFVGNGVASKNGDLEFWEGFKNKCRKYRAEASTPRDAQEIRAVEI